ncbi:MAG: DUF1993 domain-containing protein [Pseudomonadota bacterium]
MSLTQLLIPAYTQMLKALSAWFEKAERQFSEDEIEALLSRRLADDMYPLSTQVRFVCLQAQEVVYRLKGEPMPDTLDALAKEGQMAGEQPGTISDARARIDETLSLLGSLPSDALDSGADQSVTISLPTGLKFDMTGEQYVRDWALPQFYFHLVTAYAIFRNQDVAIGKPDYVLHMFAYARPGTIPQGS